MGFSIRTYNWYNSGLNCKYPTIIVGYIPPKIPPKIPCFARGEVNPALGQLLSQCQGVTPLDLDGTNGTSVAAPAGAAKEDDSNIGVKSEF
jgi:hypothetical protein